MSQFPRSATEFTPPQTPATAPDRVLVVESNPVMAEIAIDSAQLKVVECVDITFGAKMSGWLGMDPHPGIQPHRLLCDASRKRTLQSSDCFPGTQI
ncbi:hypothetical protein GCM10027262_61300 [Nocardia tengchongensis]